MNIGFISIWIALVAAFAGTIASVISGRSSRGESIGRFAAFAAAQRVRLYYLVIAAIAFASALLLFFLFHHDFAYSYVAQYSSKSLSPLYLLSAFWAGQEGTFLLWALLVAVMGYIFQRTTRPDDHYAMSLINAFIAFLCLLLIAKSPFSTVSPVPADGQGMNPLLQDPWMAIHPPILFVGYAAAIFPFALALSGLFRKNYEAWFKFGFRWTVFGALALGAGIIIGGFWAYEVLGWGGYWGWDPVENSSLVPWLLLLALIHGLLIQRASGGLMRTNLFLALSAFILVMYATFLTRSGVLADFSVHSFVDLGINNYLVGIMIMSVGLGFGTFIVRMWGIKAPKLHLAGINRELALLLSMFAIALAATFTFVGMSSPLITGLFGKASQVDTSFYNTVNMPVSIAMALLLGVTPFLGWSRENTGSLLKRLSMPLALTALSVAIAYVAGVRLFMQFLFIGSAAFGLISNVIIAFRLYKKAMASFLLDERPFLGWGDKNAGSLLKRFSIYLVVAVLSFAITIVIGPSYWLFWGIFSMVFALIGNIIIVFHYKNGFMALGGPVAHIGVALLLIGIIGSNKFDRTKTIVLKQGEPQSAQGYSFTFKGVADPGAQKPKMQIEVSDGNQTYLSTPRLYFSQYNQALLREPFIKIMPMQDLYISPIEYKEPKPAPDNPTLELTKGQTTQFGGYQIQFVRFETGQHNASGGMSVGAVLNVTLHGKSQEIVPTMAINDRGERSDVAGDLPEVTMSAGVNAKPKIFLDGMNVEEKKVVLSVHGLDAHAANTPAPELTVEISTKPLMMVVWTGAVLIIAGSVISFRRRTMKSSV